MNKSTVMRNAWQIFRSKFLRGLYKINTFADALRQAWKDAKQALAARRTARWLNAKELTAGDTIRFAPPGCASMPQDKTIAKVEPSELGYAGITVTFTDGAHAVFSKSDTVERIAA